MGPIKFNGSQDHSTKRRCTILSHDFTILSQMPRSPKKALNSLPEGFEVTKKRKTHTKDKSDRKLIKKLSQEAVALLQKEELKY